MQTTLFVIVFVVILQLSCSFTTKAVAKPSANLKLIKKNPVLWGMLRRDSFSEGGETFDIEAARRKLELLVGAGDERELLSRETSLIAGKSNLLFPSTTTEVSQSSSKVRISLPKAPPLTTIERERRSAEILLLKQLRESDEALTDLWTLWYNERGTEAAKRLTIVDELSSDERTWPQAEFILKEMIEEYGVYFVEPINRLATLYYLQEKFQEAEKLCKTVLAVKPWHVGALSGIVMVYAAMHAVDNAREHAAHRLPSLGATPSVPNRRRGQWVDKAIRNAEAALAAAEVHLVEAFGDVDDHTTKYVDDGYGEVDWQ